MTDDVDEFACLQQIYEVAQSDAPQIAATTDQQYP